jgi:hypothetical protein
MSSTITQQIRTQVIVTAIFGALTFILGGTVSSAVTVYFNDANLGPADTLQIGGVTVTGGQLATVSGLGLGKDNGIGPAGEFDQQMYFPAGQVGPETDMNSGVLQLNVEGVINSVTIVPYFSIFSGSGVLISDTLAFGITAWWGGTPSGFPQVNIAQSSIGQPITLYPSYSNPPPATTLVQFQIASDFGEFNDYFLGYRMQHQSEEQTYQFGITVVSLDYTPVSNPGTVTFVPEPSAITFLGVGLIGLLFARQGRRSHRGKRSFITE